ncbi:restriction system protein [Maridesulfovibrio ferrireducens]|uniref:Restriction system protein n=1 Tax=Maridesulfovibrio ferrireducens TaxID=246191 RepID=A0A1G9IDM7_9BACT|nr:restriction endonuclease [Maridesulfovibrio ferrireducens]SDL22944.1 restriction system protein [Maridesulfovibrio ferrireducens]
MAIPDYQTLMLPVLKLASDSKEHKFRDAVEQLADEFSLSSEERSEFLPSGNQAVFNNRVGWARSYLKQAGLLADPKRGFFTITEKGIELLASNPSEITTEILSQYPEFIEFRNRRKNSKEKNSSEVSEKAFDSLQTPEDALASAYKQLRKSLESELLTIVKDSSPSFFEKLVVDLLVNMGYGGNRQDAGKALGKSGDGGIDGIINEDRLGLDVIYIQAKRWEGSVGRPEIQKFAGALQGQRAKKGVFITSSSFTKGAEEYVSMIDTRIILIDGERLGRLMVDHNVGVSTVGKYEVKKVDSDYFDSE